MENQIRASVSYFFGVHVEFLSAHVHLLIPLHIFPGITREFRSPKFTHSLRLKIVKNAYTE